MPKCVVWDVFKTGRLLNSKESAFCWEVTTMVSMMLEVCSCVEVRLYPSRYIVYQPGCFHILRSQDAKTSWLVDDIPR